MNERKILELLAASFECTTSRFQLLREVEALTQKRLTLIESLLKLLAASSDEKARKFIENSADIGKLAEVEMKRIRARCDTMDDALITQMRQLIDGLEG
jgi:hypothetical protein